LLIGLLLILAACGGEEEAESPAPQPPQSPAELRPQRPPDLPAQAVQQVLDGNRVQLADGTTMRLLGVDAPQEGQLQAAEASAFLTNLIEGQEIGLEVGVAPTDETGQAVAYLWAGPLLMNYELIRAGYAYHARSSAPSQHDGFLAQAESLAQAEQLGLWATSRIPLQISYVMANPPGPDEESWAEEEVQIRNTGTDAISLEGYSLSDSSEQQFIFPASTTLQAGQSLSVFSGCGVSTNSLQYWCAGGPVWDNTSDSIFLRDPQGAIIDYLEITAPR
jgi:micrococcal nuclease